MDKPAAKWRFHWSYWLLLIPYVAMMWVPYYNRVEPQLVGIPFFYWYQLVWIVLGAILLLPAYLLTTRGDRR